MTITLLGPDGVELTAQQYRQARAAEHGGGSGRRLGGRSGFRVDTPSNVLTVTSTTWTLGPCAAMIDPGMTTHQGMYGWSTDANVTGALDPADANNPRKDVLFIQVNDDTAGDGSGLVSANVVYLAGLPSSTPTAPYADGFLVGTISVPQLGGGSPTVSLNPARYAAAGAPLPVSSLDERDAIPDKHDGLTVRRLDITGRPTETYDAAASKWSASDVPWTNMTISDAFSPAVTADGWTGAKYAVKNGWVIITGAVARETSWGHGQRISTMPVHLRPTHKVQGTTVQIMPDGIVLIPAGAVAASFGATWPLF